MKHQQMLSAFPLKHWNSKLERIKVGKFTFDVMGMEIENRNTHCKFSRRLASTMELSSNLLHLNEQSFLR